MLNRFHNGTIIDFKAGEDIKNNDIYILDPATREIRKARDCDEWLTCQLVYVNNPSLNNTIDFCINKGETCRCWIGYFVI
jgi:hypothetical protein